MGCGWLGLPLGRSFVQKGYSINGSTTSKDKIDTLRKEGITPFNINLSENGVSGDIALFLDGCDTIIINIPPKLRKANAENYVSKIQHLLNEIEKSTISNVLFISSTSVYSDDNSKVTEDTKELPETESGKQLLKVEQLLQSKSELKTTILRFGGLIGGDRHPVHFLSGKENLKNPEAPVNLIHQKDCIGIINSILENKCWGEVFNAVYPEHPNRRDYYFQKATDKNLKAPGFDENSISRGKTISSDKVIRVLKYEFTTKI